MPFDFDIEGARKAGATDADIADYFKTKYNVDFDFGGARKSGSSDADILGYLNTKYGQATNGKSTADYFNLGLTPEQIKQKQEQPPQAAPTNNNGKFVNFGEEVKPKPTVNRAGIEIGVKPGKDTHPDIKKAIDNAVDDRLQKTGSTDREFAKQIITENYKNGDLIPAKNAEGKDVLKRGTGLIDSFVDAVQKHHNQSIEDNVVAGLSKEDAIKHLNAKMQHPDIFHTGESETAPSGITGEAGQLVGENSDLLAKGTVGTIAGASTAMTGGESFGTFLAMAKDLANSGYSQTLQNNYQQLKQQHPEMSDSDAYDHANKAALVGEGVSLATGAALSGSLKPIVPKATTPITGVINGLEQSLKHTVKTSPKMIGSGAAGSVINDIASAAIGVDVKGSDVEKHALESAKGMAVMHFGLWAMAEPTRIPSYILPQVKNVVASAPREQVLEFYNTMENAGAVPGGTTQKVNKDLSDFDAAKAKIKPTGSEEKDAVIVGLIQERDALKKSKDKLDETEHEDIDAKVEAINDKIAIAKTSKNPLSVEEDKLTGQQLGNPKLHEDLTKPEREGIKVPTDYGGVEVVEKGEGENKTFTPKAWSIEEKGGLGIRKPIKIEGEAFTDKTKAKAAAEDALKQHYYENKMPAVQKPQKKGEPEQISQPIELNPEITKADESKAPDSEPEKENQQANEQTIKEVKQPEELNQNQPATEEGKVGDELIMPENLSGKDADKWVRDNYGITVSNSKKWVKENGYDPTIKERGGDRIGDEVKYRHSDKTKQVEGTIIGFSKDKYHTTFVRLNDGSVKLMEGGFLDNKRIQTEENVAAVNRIDDVSSNEFKNEFNKQFGTKELHSDNQRIKSIQAEASGKNIIELGKRVKDKSMAKTLAIDFERKLRDDPNFEDERKFIQTDRSGTIDNLKWMAENGVHIPEDLVKEAGIENNPSKLATPEPEKQIPLSDKDNSVAIESGTQLLNIKDPKEQNFFKRFDKRDGKDVAVVDYVFSDGGKLRQDEKYIPIERFNEQYHQVSKSEFNKIKASDKTKGVKLGGESEEEKLNRIETSLGRKLSSSKQEIKKDNSVVDKPSIENKFLEKQLEARKMVAGGSHNVNRDLSDYTPELHKEISPDELKYFLPNENATGGLKEVQHFADSKNLALGQGDSKGILLSFDSNGIEGLANLSKPALKFTFPEQEGEYTTRNSGNATKFKENLKSIEIKPDAKWSKSDKVRAQSFLDKIGWQKKTENDGTVKYTKPTSTKDKVTIEPESKLSEKQGEVTKPEDTKKADFDKKVDKIADNLIKRLTPKTTKGLGKQGVGIEEIIRTAAEIIKKAHEIGTDIKEAIEKAIEHIRKNWDKEWGDFDEQAVRDEMNKVSKEELDPELTKMANAVNDAFIEGKFGTDALDSIIAKLQDTGIRELYNKVKDRIKKGVLDVKAVRERLMTTRQGSEEDQAALLYDLAELKGKETAIQKEIIEETDQKKQTLLQNQLMEVQNDMMDNALANRNIGRTASTIFRLRKVWVDKVATLLDFTEQYMASKKLKELSPEQEKEVKAFYNKIRELEAKKKQLKEDYEKSVLENDKLKAENEKLKELAAKTKTQKKADRGKKSDESIKKSNERIQKAKDNLRNLGGGQLSSGVDPKIAIEIGKIAGEYFYQGFVKIDELIGNVLDTVKEIYPTWTEKDVREHLFPDFKGEAKLTYTSKDFEASSKDAREKLQAYKEIEKEYALKMYEWQKDRREDIMQDRPFKEKAISSVLQWQRFAVLSYPTTLVKLLAVIGHQLSFKPLKFALQKGIYELANIPKRVSGGRLTNPLDKSALWGDPTLNALGKYYSALIKNFSLANIKEHFSGIDTKEILYGKQMVYDEWAAAKGLLEMPGRSHGYLKSFVKNPEFQFAHEMIISHGLNRMDEISKQLKDPALTDAKKEALQEEYKRWDVTDIDNMERINKMALDHGKWAILMNDNKFVDKFRVWADKKELSSALIRSELPIVKIPINFVSRAFAYKYGLIQTFIPKTTKLADGTTETLRPSLFKIIFKGTKDLTPEQADLVGKTLNLGSMGAAFFVLGYLNKKNLTQNDDGSVDVFGVHISKNLVHSPELESLLGGASTAHQQEKGTGFLQAYAESDMDILKKNPFLTMLQYGFLPNVAEAMVSKQSKDKVITKIQDAAFKKIADMIIPGMVKQPAQWLDTGEKGMHPMSDYIQRKPEGEFLEKLWQNMELGIPVLRENVPMSKAGGFTPEDLKQPEWKYLKSKELDIGSPQRKSIILIDKDTKKERELTDKEYNDFVTLRKEKLKKDIAYIIQKGAKVYKDENDNHGVRKKAADLSPEELKVLLKAKKSAASKAASEELFPNRKKEIQVEEN